MRLRPLYLLIAIVGLSCGATPKEVAFFRDVFRQRCSQIYKCLSADQRGKLDLGFYIGTSEADCAAVNGESAAEEVVRGAGLYQTGGNNGRSVSFGNATLSDTQARTCLDAVQKLTCDDVRKLISMSFPSESSRDKDARTVLQVSESFSCFTNPGQACKTDAMCQLGTVTGACFAPKLFPIKDPNDAADMQKFITDNPAVFCGPSVASF